MNNGFRLYRRGLQILYIMRKIYINNKSGENAPEGFTAYVAVDDIQFMTVEELMDATCPFIDKDEQTCEDCKLRNKCGRDAENAQYAQSLLVGEIRHEAEVGAKEAEVGDEEAQTLSVMSDEELREVYCAHYKETHSCLYCSHGSQCDTIIDNMREAQRALLDKLRVKS